MTDQAFVAMPSCGNQAGELCPNCWEAVLREEGAHGRCDACGWIGKCCEG
ncbi:MAG TPA: hypothetical protein VNU01_13085 [Egibacteraceae bacterium]|nr:hypothetical protein [Egibacteraceae bacterium]